MGDLATWLKSFRALGHESETAQLKRMYMLVELYPLTKVWETAGTLTWAAFLRDQQLCALARFESFEQATQMYKRPLIERIGVDAAVVLMRIEPHLRDLTLKRIDSYIRSYDQTPNLRMVYAFVHRLRKSVVVEQEPGPKGTHRFVTKQ